MAFFPPTVHDPTRVVAIWAALPLTGFAPGRFITVRRDAPVWTTVDGTNGEFKRVRSRKKSGTVEIVLRASSRTNRALGIFLKADENSGTIIAPLTITDTLNGSLHFSSRAYIERFPEMSYSVEEGDILWRFRCDEIDMQYPGLSAETLVRSLQSNELG